MDAFRIRDAAFFTVRADALAVALLGKILVRKTGNLAQRFYIAETECYMGITDSACHAARKNPIAAKVLWERGGTLYVHMVYGMHYMLNIVAGPAGDPTGVLLRGAAGMAGPGRLTRALGIGADFNREDLLTSQRIWIEDSGLTPLYTAAPRVGIDYAQEADRNALWRFLAYDSLGGK